MGFFSPKKTISVASTLYNLAGDEDDRPNYLKGTLFSSVLANSPSLADAITDSYFNGPGLQQRHFFNYAVRNDLSGLPTASIVNSATADPAIVAAEIPVNPSAPAGAYITVVNSQVVDGDADPFIIRWILENHQARVSEDWLGDYNNDTGDFTVQFPNGDTFVFTDSEYSPDQRYIQARYFHILDQEALPVDVGPTTTIPSQDPDLNTYDLISSDGASVPVTFTRTTEVVMEYSDGTPTSTTYEDASVAGSLNRSTDVYEKTELIENVGFQTHGQFRRLTYIGDDYETNTYYSQSVVVEDIGGGVTRTTTRTTTGEEAFVQWTRQLDTQELYDSSVLYGEEMFIYAEGSGNANLDALFAEADSSGFQEFYPFLPLRLKNVAVNEGVYTSNGLFEETKKAYRKATKTSIDKVLESIADNDSIDDIDYAYIMYGVSLNVKENACKKYIFKFLENLIPYQNATQADITAFQDSIDAYNAAQQELENWQNLDWQSTDWINRTPRPTIPSLSVPNQSSIRLKADSPIMPSFDVRLVWNYIGIEQFNGVYNGSNVGEVTLVKGSSIDWIEIEGLNSISPGSLLNTFQNINKSMESFEIYWQISANTYRKMTVHGLQHLNYIYKGKNVRITSHEALDDNDISGFIIPLHNTTVRELSIVDYTQMATANTHILFNSYEVTKQKWYEVAFFRILIIVAIIVVSVILFPGAFAAAGGVLGANAAVGAAIGLGGTAAIVAGAVLNYLASLVIGEVLKVAANELFGEEYGAIIASMVTFAISIGSSGGFGFNAETILGLGSVIANGYAGMVAADIADTQSQIEQEQEEYEKQMEYINDLIKNLGGNDLNFNPLFLTDSVKGNGSNRRDQGYIPETADQFIQRTTMTGTDVVALTHSMVYDYVNIQRTLPKN